MEVHPNSNTLRQASALKNEEESDETGMICLV
jgi:hypothetical protein